jgi:hypothetical protein
LWVYFNNLYNGTYKAEILSNNIGTNDIDLYGKMRQMALNQGIISAFNSYWNIWLMLNFFMIFIWSLYWKIEVDKDSSEILKFILNCKIYMKNELIFY